MFVQVCLYVCTWLLSKAPFTWDRDEVKPEWKLKLSTCLHDTGTKITKCSIYSPCQAIFFFRWLLLACVVPMSRLQPRPVWNVFLFSFIPVWSQSARSSRRNDLRQTSIINNIMTETKWSRFDFVPVSYKRGL
jgi:hypothetical protein